MTHPFSALGGAAALVLCALAANDAAAFQVTPYGSGVNPAGSLSVISGEPKVGTIFGLGVANTAIPDSSPAFAFLAFSLAPFPNGFLLPDYGMSGPGAPGELLIDVLAPNYLFQLGPKPWAGGLAPPAPFFLGLLEDPSFAGATLYLQGVLAYLTPTLRVTLSNGLAVTLTAPYLPSMVAIEPGTFEMGSNAASGLPYFGSTNTQPVHTVTISSPFWMGRYEVTQAEYQALMGVNPSVNVGPNRPVEGVTWNDAVAYCAALTAAETLAGNVPVGYQYRLPTEAEWEYACRAGTTTEFNVGAGLLCSDAWFSLTYHPTLITSCGNSPETVDVGGYAPNAWGLYDMHGNVWEWCLDSFASYNAAPVTDPFVIAGPDRVLRGGSWSSSSFGCRSAFRRDLGGPDFAFSDVGFRVVLAPVIALPDPAKFALIPAGTFQMGSNAANVAPYFGQPNEKPVHQVTISSPFWMGRYEVTQAEYQALMGVNPSFYVGPNRPVERVSWNDAVAYCTALTAAETLAGNVPVGYEYRLPTEAEWEYACRAGTTTEFNVGAELLCSDARFSETIHPSLSWTSCGNPSGTVDVGGYAPNAWGLYDMHGNVWEWCLDSFASYSAAPVTDPFVTGSVDRVLRGGSWFSLSSSCRSAYRNGSVGGTFTTVGFRVVLAPIPPLPPPTGMVAIEPGTFQMGSNAASGTPYFGSILEQPVHTVTISYPFWMGQHEVTQAEYEAVMGSNPSFFIGPNRPVERVSWNDAVAYCAALTAAEALAGNVPVGYEYRLPTEAEWEYACRAGTTTEFNVGAGLLCSDARFNGTYHPTLTLTSCANPAGTVDVGSYAPNAWGLYDMHGNVREWCLDSFLLYSAEPVTDPFVTGAPSRVVRSGGWSTNSSGCRSANRVNLLPGNTNDNLGFRVVLAPVLVP
jgi:formylglycine-generating enzyme required for sulfatase activity